MLPTPKPNNKEKPILHLDGIEEYLRDKSVCATYLALIEESKALFNNKEILILYSGFGFLALTVAKTQAKHIHVICET